ncbi:hypothetical protein GGR56DRAFT_670504 [Xylariaceae sp. FL0804]|nr:hypothetical protein GGR56DRAFT_670504 [Xylariaceae sp. FL0804]
MPPTTRKRAASLATSGPANSDAGIDSDNASPVQPLGDFAGALQRIEDHKVKRKRVRLEIAQEHENQLAALRERIEKHFEQEAANVTTHHTTLIERLSAALTRRAECEAAVAARADALRAELARAAALVAEVYRGRAEEVQRARASAVANGGARGEVGGGGGGGGGKGTGKGKGKGKEVIGMEEE